MDEISDDSAPKNKCNGKAIFLFLLQLIFFILNVIADVVIIYWFFKSRSNEPVDEAVARVIGQAIHLRMH
jgi:flagellar basal body-associated protein FliL